MFSALDAGLAALALVSVLVGVFRGLCRELFTVLTWVLALFAAINLTPRWLPLWESWVASPAIRYAATFFLIFLVVVVIGALINVLLGRWIRESGFSGLDRLLGAGFGILRSAVVIAALVFVVGAGSLAERSWWQESRVVAVAVPVLCDPSVQLRLAGIQPSGRLADWFGGPIAWDAVCQTQGQTD